MANATDAPMHFDLAFPDGDESPLEQVLPFRLLVIGAFEPDQSELDYEASEPVPLNARQFGRFLAGRNLVLTLPVAELALPAPVLRHLAGIDQLTVGIRSLDDFNPQQLVQCQPELQELETLWLKLQRALREPEPLALTERERDYLELDGLELDSDDVDPALLMFLATDVGQQIHETVNVIIHHPRWQDLEASWRALWMLMQAVESLPNCQVALFSARREHLSDDLLRSARLQDSHAFDQVYSREYGQLGGKPYGALLVDYCFGPDGEDLALLAALARLGQAAHAPVLASAAPRFFGVEQYADLAVLNTLKDLFNSERYLKWRAFQARPEAGYLVMTLPRLLMRDLHHMDNGAVTSPLFNEDVTLAAQPYLWSNATYGLAACLLRSFDRFGMCTHISGEEGGLVTDLPTLRLARTQADFQPVEVLLSENREAELISLGFTPVSVAKAAGQVLFPATNTVQWGHIQRSHRSVMLEHLGAQLPYLFVVLRMAHLLKVVFRDQIGAPTTPGEIEAQLQRVMRRYVADVEEPSLAVRARRPLKQATVSVRTDPERGDLLTVDLAITPHMKYLDQDFSLALDLPLQ